MYTQCQITAVSLSRGIAKKTLERTLLVEGLTWTGLAVFLGFFPFRVWGGSARPYGNVYLSQLPAPESSRPRLRVEDHSAGGKAGHPDLQRPESGSSRILPQQACHSKYPVRLGILHSIAEGADGPIIHNQKTRSGIFPPVQLYLKQTQSIR